MHEHPSYELFEQLGRGEHTVVYRAYDMDLGREVAIKCLDEASRQDSHREEQFLKEAGFLAQFEHEHVVRVHTVEREQGWIVMELMKGTLAAQIASQPCSPDVVRSVVRQILRALDFLHRKGKVHGAVRPSNILINEHGTVKLSDFEPSSFEGELRVPTASRKYLAPELIRPQFGPFGPAVDLYCLGFTALELLTGPKFDTLFPGTGEEAIDADVAWLRWHSSEESLPAVKTLVPGTPDDLAEVLDRLLAKRVAERPASAADVLDALADRPLLPVAVPESAASPVRPDDAIASVVREIAPPRSSGKPRAAGGSSAAATPASPRAKTPGGAGAAAAGRPAPRRSLKDRVNRVLEKPYVLYPLCATILLAALAIGWKLNQDGSATTDPGKPPVSTVDLRLNITPDPSGAVVVLNGREQPANEQGNFALEPGTYELEVNKDGFEPFTATLELSSENRVFDVNMQPLRVADIDPDDKGRKDREEEPMPRSADVRIEVVPADAELEIAGRPEPLTGGATTVAHQDSLPLTLTVRKDGFRPLARTLSWNQLEQSGFAVRIELERMTAPEPAKEEQVADLPASLVAKEGSPVDPETGLPLRVYAVRLQDTAPLELALVRPGEYAFGVTAGDPRTWELEGARVLIGAPFYVAIHETSAAQYAVFARQQTLSEQRDATIRPVTHLANESDVQRPPSNGDLPAREISVVDAARFCSWAGGRLPTEQEWEAAVRGPDDAGYPVPWGTAAIQWGEGRAKLFRGDDSPPLPVDGLEEGASPLGLLNTIGNVSEWCNVPHGPDEFLVKGCSYRTPPGDHVRVTWRGSASWRGAPDIGFRLVVPVADEPDRPNPALAFVPPVEPLVDEEPPMKEAVDGGDRLPPDNLLAGDIETETEELAAQFVGEAELIIDSGGFISEVHDLAFSPDGSWLAACGDKVVRVWDLRSGALAHTLRGDRSRTSYGNCYAVEFTPDGKHLLVGVNDYRQHGSIRVYETGSLNEISALLPGHTAPCRKIAFSRDGRYMTSADADGNVLVWDWPERRVLKRIPPRNADQPIYDALSFPTAEPYLLGVDFDGPQVFSIPDGARLGPRDTLPDALRAWLMDIFGDRISYPFGTTQDPRVLDFRLDGSAWAAAGAGEENGQNKFWVAVWPSRSLDQPAASQSGMYAGHGWSITCVDIGPANDLVASGDKFGEVHVWNRASGERLHRFAGQGSAIYNVAFDRNSSQIAFGTRAFAPDEWRRNNYGAATKVLDLRQRAIVDAASLDSVQLIDEQPRQGDTAVTVDRAEGSASYLLQKRQGTRLAAQYRISSGRNPTVFTLLDDVRLGVEQPVVFGDNEGLLALWDSSGDELKRAFLGHGSMVTAVSPAPNGRMIASGSTDRTIRLWSLEQYHPTGIFDFRFENTSVIEVPPGTSSAKAGVQVGDRILTIDGKSMTDMYNLMLERKFSYRPGQAVPVEMQRGDETYQYEMTLVDGYDFADPLLNVYLGDDGQWIIWNPRGYYDASPGADRLIGWHVNRGPDKSARFFRVQQFREQLYRPDIIDRILETGDVEQAIELANQARQEDENEYDFRDTREIAENHPPRVRIDYPAPGQRLEERTVSLRATVQSVNGLSIQAATLLVNGSVAHVFRPTEPAQQEMTIEHSVQLPPGTNELTLIAANARASSSGGSVIVEVPSDDIDRHRADAYVLAVGISAFEQAGSPFETGPYAADDAEAFVAAARAHQGGKLYGKVHTRLLKNEAATRAAMLDGMQWLVDRVGRNDVAMIFVASRGFADSRGNYYLATHDADADRARSTALSWRDFTALLHEDLPACQRVVFLDAPLVGDVPPGMRDPLMDLAAPELGTVFFAASTLQRPLPVRPGLSRGTFTQAILATLQDQAADVMPTPRDALLNSTELAMSVKSRVRSLTRDRQHPVTFSPPRIRLVNLLELQD